jgi:cyclopropane-fatty-acyl-phospholipid synthase
VSTVERSLRAEPPARGRPLERVAVAILERALAHLEGGTLEVELPDGSLRRFGAGPPVRLAIRDRRFFRRLATRGKLGLGESFTAGEWTSDDLPALFELLILNAEAAAGRHPVVRRVLAARPRANRRAGLFRARRNIAYHYDLGNELFAAMLDETMTYSCAVFERPDESLEQAQLRKLRLVCEKLRLGPDDHVLEIGCGWGSFARVAAAEYGARVTGLTISREQARLARERTEKLDVEILERDYREVEGRFTKVASIEMLEAVGERHLGDFFATVEQVLEPGGLACVQTILVPDRRFERYRKTPDWIERYVFPGCLIPSLGAITRSLGRLGLRSLEDIGPHYAETLRRWRARFHAAGPHDERFARTWDFYLAYCEAAFRTRSLHDVQLVLGR